MLEGVYSQKTIDTVLHVLRNPYGRSSEEVRWARLAACDLIEDLQSAFLNMRDFAADNGLDTACYGKEGQ